MEGSVKKHAARSRVALWFLFVGCLFLSLRFLPWPALDAFMRQENSTRFFDRNGVLLHVRPLEDGLRREYYALESLPADLVQAFIDAEDKNFYHHCGVDLVSIIRAMRQNRKAGHVVSGASTITMQLVRLIYPRRGSTTVWTKLIEMARAIRLEVRLSKKKILELYLNTVPFGFQVEGVGSAARTFFSVPPGELSLENMRNLALVPRRPALYAPKRSFDYPSLCPHYVAHIVHEYHSSGRRLPDEMILAVDSALVLQTEKYIQQKLEEFRDARIHNGAALVINNRTGEIVVWAGNAAFEDKEHAGELDGVLVQNQPGSSMKPFLYALALEQGFEPSAVLPDIPQDFGSSGVYVPLNFNNRYNGPVRFRVSLASSLNVTAVYLLQSVGMEAYVQLLERMGFHSLASQKEALGLSLALGGGEVSLLEMVRAFSVFANDGVLYDLSFFEETQKERTGIRIYDADTARILCDMLGDKGARELGFGHAAVFDTPYPSMFKTGTSNQFQNIIALGATREWTAGVWMGNFAGETVVGETGSSIPAQVVRKLLDELTARHGAQPFLQPEAYKKQEVCALSGMKPSSFCPSVTKEYVRTQDVAKRRSCTYHYQEGGVTKVSYPSEYQHWANSRNVAGTIDSSASALQIVYPRNNAVFVFDPSLPSSVQMLPVQAVGGADSSALLSLDGHAVGIADGLLRWSVPLSPGTHRLHVQCGMEYQEVTYTVK